MVATAGARLRLPGPLALVPATRRAAAQFELPDLSTLVRDFGAVVPATFDGGELHLHTRRHRVVVRPDVGQRAYLVESVEPLRLRDHGRLSRGALMVSVPGWRAYADATAVPAEHHTYHAELAAAWQRLVADPPGLEATRRPQRHDDLCDVLDAVIEADRQLDLVRLGVGSPRRSRVGGDDPGEKAARAQHDAVDALRNDRSANPGLLALIADGTFAPAPEAGAADAPRPAEPLDRAQTDAFVRALGVQDVMLVLGPPGTGKIRTTAEIVRAAAGRGERVLVTGPTTGAVDTVLERLPADHRVLRIGDEGKAAAVLRRGTLERTESSALRLAPWLTDTSPAPSWLTELGRAIGDGDRAVVERATADQNHRNAIALVERRYTHVLAAAHTAVERTRQDLAAAQAAVETARQRLDGVTAEGLIGFAYRPLTTRRAAELDRATAALTEAEREATRAQNALTELVEEMRRACATDPAVRDCAERVASADVAVSRTGTAAARAAAALRRLLTDVVAEPPDAGKDPATLKRFHQWAAQVHPILQERARLLADWRDRLKEPAAPLPDELVRYADVVGVACAGLADRPDLTFDLVVIVDAGRIPLPAALVPMVRARRAVLVGDPQDLPPYADEEVRGWLALPGAADPGQNLLGRSLLDRLARTAPPANRVLLDRQRRMPAVLAEFVSAQFYDGLLTSDVKEGGELPLFTSPLVVLDTADLSDGERAEREAPGTELWNAAGYTNTAEANMILGLTQWYSRIGVAWTVLVPYRAQVDLLRARLGSDDPMSRARITTVDALSPSWALPDVVVFGFTRSNREGQVDRLRELRRLNAAIGRTRKQLVLVGDFASLRAAADPDFRKLIGRLGEHAIRHGAVLPSKALRPLLADAWKGFAA
ncbi:hypothetical protein Val02_68360 [Virgisporangium aliadipatigenens]|uniref:AAA domain-containing protein n=1 Tax=Virgisporangium aliadipatigenens TaxID=741659 RepID=A0A8J3YU78_9ACTN|nr:AAA domain-containing protein [Virgisporangium aliadipatigenens]GIJ49950.1 hypothetical protein Val02_68360 [Virgisporangium aliadipatigenens]